MTKYFPSIKQQRRAPARHEVLWDVIGRPGCWPGSWLMRLCNETPLTSDAPPPLPPQGVLQAPRPPVISAGSADQPPVVLLSCSTMLPVKTGTGTDGIFTSGVPSPLDDQRRSIAVTFAPSPRWMKIDWTTDRAWNNQSERPSKSWLW